MISLEDLYTFAKRRGFFFPSSDIYGGFAGIYDYGPLGVEFINNIKRLWWYEMVWKDPSIVGLDSAIIMHPSVWRASGHTTGFVEPCVVSSKTKRRYRIDHLLEQIGIDPGEGKETIVLYNKYKNDLPIGKECVDDLGKPFWYNVLVECNLGSLDPSDPTYLRGETCQGIYINYKHVVESMRKKLPFGIAQIGKVFRNEISPRQFLFRTREFEQMEMQYFVREQDAEKTYDSFLDKRFEWMKSLGLKRLRKTQHAHLVFYARTATDIEYEFPFGWGELEGVHNRGNYDLTQHTTHSKTRLAAFNEETKEWEIPHIIETSVGVGRLVLALLAEAYSTDEVGGEERIVLKLNPALAPIRTAVLPLEKKHREKAKEIQNILLGNGLVQYDETQSIGKRYRRQDEVGTPCCITVDDETLNKDIVTIRDRDTIKQEHVPVSGIKHHLSIAYPQIY